MEAKLIAFLTSEFAEKFTDLDDTQFRELLDATNSVVHSSRWNKHDPFTTGINFDKIRAVLYSFSS